MSETIKRLRGLKDLIRDGVEHGSAAIEKVHLETASRPFTVFEHIPPISIPSKGMHAIHDVTARSIYQVIRIVGHVVTESLDVALDAIQKAQAEAEAEAGGAVASTAPVTPTANEPEAASPPAETEAALDPHERPSGEGP